MACLRKFMQTLNDNTYRELVERAQKRGISVQELFRAVIFPDWKMARTKPVQKQLDPDVEERVGQG